MSENNMKRMSYLDALGLAQREELESDPNAIIIGEDISLYAAGGVYGNTEASRIRSTPISECGFAGMAIGAAITGLRPIVDLTIANFVYLAADPIINQAARLRYMTGGQFKVPVTFRISMWYGCANGAQHSDRPYPMFMNVPGLKIVTPATPADAKGLLKAAMRDDNPVLVFEDNNLWSMKDDVPLDTDFVVPIGKAITRREGSDVSIISVAGCLRHALKAAEDLAKDGISADVVDMRTLVPLDKEAILNTVAKTGRVVIADYAHRTCGAAAEIAAIIVEDGFDLLRKPIKRVVTPDVPIPFSPPMEKPLFPSRESIAAAARALMM